jgi:hypothetical protein
MKTRLKENRKRSRQEMNNLYYMVTNLKEIDMLHLLQDKL